ncbi:winged helix-turn-helix domain-containing protein [Micromonospora sp. NBC_01699]|uniref:AfsR/SARP family transcriptional regulator n=1 Tax=Micromonospora sp. NBC_01699 TaxID=2975984 RepID=UPI002E27F627|nr:BTAD domain-containing putative transcriptional regulator [Micromonospora sp. NBC_01699]
MDLRLLGSVQIHVEDRIIGLGRATERCVLATLALSAGRPVRVSTLVENVWGDHPPAKADETIAHYVRAVRRVIEEAGGGRDWLVNRRPRSYELRVSPAVVDYHRFVALVAEGRAKANSGEHDDAVVAYRRALDLWLGDPLANVNGDWADRCRHALQQERLDAICALFEQQIKVGDHVSVATTATRLVNEIVPTDRVITLAMVGLAHCGQQSMIPDFVSRAARRMWDAVGVRPSADVNALARRLASDTTIAGSGHEPLGAPFLPDIVDRSSPPPSTDNQPKRNGAVAMTAWSNGTVYQAGGNQYITESE